MLAAPTSLQSSRRIGEEVVRAFSSASSRHKENEMKAERVATTLQNLADSEATLHKTRAAILKAVWTLRNRRVSVGVRAANAIAIIEGVLSDPKNQSFVRTTLWSATAELESIRE
jgi:uncharacterized protein (UPF0147 family)